MKHQMCNNSIVIIVAHNNYIQKKKKTVFNYRNLGKHRSCKYPTHSHKS